MASAMALLAEYRVLPRESPLPHCHMTRSHWGNIERKFLPSIQPSALLEKNNPIERQYRT
jgi:hypothetical protein